MRRFVVDTVTNVTFFTVVATFSEAVIAGMGAREVLVTRLIMLPVMVLTGRPYGLWRDWVFARLRPARRFARTLTDIVAFLGFQVPVYAATLAVAGADRSEIATAIGSAIVFMILLSRPFGLLLDLCRRWAGVADVA